jgi:hypothetical protein
MTRISAVITLSAAGTGEQPLPGMVNRLKNIYKQSDDRFVRGSVVAAMQGQKDRKPAIAFLKSIASEDPNHQDFPEASLNAVSSLSKMGQDGLAALRDLRQANSVADPSARGFIDWYLGKPAQR